MPAVTAVVPHQLGAEPAVERLKARFEAATTEHQDKIKRFEGQWNGNTYQCSFATMGVEVRATVAVQADSVNVRAGLPLAALMFKGMIEKRIREEFAKLLA